MKRLAVLAAGGTGGHMFPAQALAEVLLQQDWCVELVTDSRGVRYVGDFPEGIGIVVLPSATPARGGIVERLFAGPRVMCGILRALARMHRSRPAVVVGFGGYPSVPAVCAAWLLGVPRLIHEQNGILGRVNRAFAPHVAYVACGVWPTALPKRACGIHVGNPVREEVRKRVGEPYRPPAEGKLSVLVVGGSQGARILSDRVPSGLARLAGQLRQRLEVAHQAREEDIGRVKDAYGRAGIAAEVAAFFVDIPRRMAEAQLVISRAGASSVAELAVIGRPAILVPYAAAAGRHQDANASTLERAGAAVVLAESDLAPETLASRVTRILGTPELARQMAAAALDAGVPDSAERLLDLVGKSAGQPGK